MAGRLTEYLEEGFLAHCPKGWACRREGRVVAREAEEFLGYAPRADVVLAEDGGDRRIWVEFEVSRADPVANHAKFATVQHLGYLRPGDAFLSMVSAHVARGRRNLASNMVSVMRRLGLDAFQTVLLPQLDGPAIFRHNHAERAWLDAEGPDVRAEVARAIRVCSPVLERGRHRIHLASDPFEVLLSLRRWNQEVRTEGERALWGRRRVRYFVFDPVSGAFAPSKFCAFVPLPRPPADREAPSGSLWMDMALYSDLHEGETRFDGRIAWTHLVRHLGFSLEDPGGRAGLRAAFERWHSRHSDLIALPQEPPSICLPPAWYLPGPART